MVRAGLVGDADVVAGALVGTLIGAAVVLAARRLLGNRLAPGRVASFRR